MSDIRSKTKVHYQQAFHIFNEEMRTFVKYYVVGRSTEETERVWLLQSEVERKKNPLSTIRMTESELQALPDFIDQRYNG